MGRARGPRIARRGLPCAVAAVTLLAAGCTMCPDTYDYSGPVPNGSAPHNDFRARSHGIVPIGVAPRPWPPIVRREPGPAAVADDSAERIPAVVPEGPLDVAAASEPAAGPAVAPRGESAR